MTYRIVIGKKVAKQMQKLPKAVRKEIDAGINTLRENPFSGKKLEGEFENVWSLRVWPYRVLYTIDKKIVTVTIVKIGHRQGVYK